MSYVHEQGNLLLDGLCRTTDALAAVVRDSASPEVWWAASPLGEDPDGPMVLALLEGAREALADLSLREGDRLRLCRADSPPFGFAYSFCSIYLLLVVFDAPFNRFSIEPHVRRSMGVLEQLVPRLPPIDDGGGRVRPIGLRDALKPPPRPKG